MTLVGVLYVIQFHSHRSSRQVTTNEVHHIKGTVHAKMKILSFRPTLHCVIQNLTFLLLHNTREDISFIFCSDYQTTLATIDFYFIFTFLIFLCPKEESDINYWWQQVWPESNPITFLFYNLKPHLNMKFIVLFIYLSMSFLGMYFIMHVPYVDERHSIVRV